MILFRKNFFSNGLLASNKRPSCNYFKSLIFFLMVESVDEKTTEADRDERERGINYNQTRLRGMGVIWMERDETATDSICVAHAHASKGPATWSTSKGLREYPCEPFSRPINPGWRWVGGGARSTWNPTRRPHSRVHSREEKEEGGGRGRWRFRKGERWGRRNKNVLLLGSRATRDPVPFESSQTCNLRELETRFRAPLCAAFLRGLSGFFCPGLLNLEQKSCSIYIPLLGRKLSVKIYHFP